MKKDDIKTLIVIVVICIICLALVYFISRAKNTDSIKDVTEYNTYFSVSNYMNSYINYLSNKDNEAIYSMLSSEYIYQNEINQNNIFDIIDTYDSSLITLKITNMKEVKINNNNYIYYIKGKLLENTFDSTEVIDNNYEVLLLADYKTLSETVYPLKDNNYEKVINSIKKINITQNEYNKIKKSSLITTENICVLYLSDYIDKLTNDIEEAYNLLSVSMKEKYTTTDLFKTHIETHRNKITTKADKCTKEDDNYIVIDNNNNKYIFTEESVMNYKVDFYFEDEYEKEE